MRKAATARRPRRGACETLGRGAAQRMDVLCLPCLCVCLIEQSLTAQAQNAQAAGHQAAAAAADARGRVGC